MLKFYLNMKTNPERASAIDNRCRQLNIHIDRFDATVGADIDENEKRHYLDNISYSHIFSRKLTNGEVGCAISHLKIFEEFLRSDEEWLFVLEDDMQISDATAGFLRDTAWIPKGVHLIQIASLFEDGQQIYRRREYMILDHGYNLIRIVKPISVGSGGYLMDKLAVKIFTETYKCKICAPIDEMLFSPFFPFYGKMKTYSLSPYVIRPNKNYVSTIGDRGRGYGRPVTIYSFFFRLYKRLVKSCLKRISKKDNIFFKC